MEERFWLRHPSLSGLQGPFTKLEIKGALASQAFPPDSYVLQDTGQSETERLAATQWSPVWQLLGVAAPKEYREPLPAGEAIDGGYGTARVPEQQEAEVTPVDRRVQLRSQSAYPGLRLAAILMCGFSIVVLVIFTIAAMAKDPSVALGALLVGAIELVGILFVYGLCQALIDIADNAVRHHYEKC